MQNQDVADIFKAMADILALQEANAHRILAYRRAAERILALDRPLAAVWRAGELRAIPGIGEVLAAKIDELMRTGRLAAYEKLQAQVGAGVVEMMRVPGVGPKRAMRFWQELGLESVAALAQAAREGRLQALSGIGARTEAQILTAIEALEAGKN